MKILCVIQCSNLGGMEKVTLDSLSLLKANGHEVRLLSLHPVGDLKTLTEDKGIPLHGTRGYRLNGLGNVGDIMRNVRQFQPDRLWLVGHNFGALVAARLSGCPAFQSIHYHHSERPLRFWKRYYGLAQKCCVRIHFVSHYIHGEVAGFFRAGNPGVCFPNMLQAPQAAPGKSASRELLGLPADAFVVGNAGWLIQRKAFDVFLQVAALVRQRIPDAVFAIAGDGEERENLERLADSLNLSDAVHFLGWQKDLEPVYAALDILLFNSHFDCLPTTPLEAMVREIPVVCSLANGGLKEVLRHGQDGFLIDRHDAQELADEIVRLHGNAEERVNTAKTGCRRVEETCSPEIHLENLNRFLELI